MSPVRLGLAGLGLIGRRHAAAIGKAAGVDLVAVADPTDAAQAEAAAMGIPCHATLEALIAAGGVDGIIIATPNTLHMDNALECIAAGLPALIEKPLTTDLDDARRLVAAGQAAGVPLLTGHHRRHNGLIARAKAVIDAGDLGRITAVNAMCWLCKPDDYFDVEWRTQAGAGPVYVNLIHDIDLMRHFCGEVASVHALEAATVRGHAVEDTAAILLRFASGALGTLSVSDATVSPWSWELTARENPAYPATSEICYQIGGTAGALSLPNLSVWSHPGAQSWWAPISETKLTFEFDDPLVRQIRQFAAVIEGRAPPLVSAEDGLRNQEVIEAIKTSAAGGGAGVAI